MKALPDPPRPTQHDPIAIALAEDIGSGDLTSRYFTGTESRRARIFAKEEAVVAGAETAAEVFGRVDPKTRVKICAHSGSRVKAGTTSAELLSLTDVMATIAAITGAELPRDSAEDSFDFLPVLEGKATAPVRDRKSVV